MAHYRIYLLRLDSSIISGDDVTCADDDAARAIARDSLAPGQQAEIWVGTRCVGKVGALVTSP